MPAFCLSIEQQIGQLTGKVDQILKNEGYSPKHFSHGLNEHGKGFLTTSILRALNGSPVRPEQD